MNSSSEGCACGGGCGCGRDGGVTCPECGGPVVATVVEHAQHMGGRVLLVTGVPGEACKGCGGYWLTEETMVVLERIWTMFFTGMPDECAVEEFATYVHN